MGKNNKRKNIIRDDDDHNQQAEHQDDHQADNSSKNTKTPIKKSRIENIIDISSNSSSSSSSSSPSSSRSKPSTSKSSPSSSRSKPSTSKSKQSTSKSKPSTSKSKPSTSKSIASSSRNTRSISDFFTPSQKPDSMITTAAVASATSNIEQENNNNKQSSSNDAFVKIIILFLKKILKFKSLRNKDIEKYTKISKILNDLSGNITKKFKKEAFKAMEKLIKNSTFLVEVKEFIKELIENFEILNINNQIVNLVDDDDDDLIEDENFENFKMKLSEIMSTLTNQSNTIVEETPREQKIEPFNFTVASSLTKPPKYASVVFKKRANANANANANPNTNNENKNNDGDDNENKNNDGDDNDNTNNDGDKNNDGDDNDNTNNDGDDNENNNYDGDENDNNNNDGDDTNNDDDGKNIKEILSERLSKPGSLGISISSFHQLSHGKFLIGFDDPMSKNRFDCLAKSIDEIKVENPRRKRPVIMLQGLPETTNLDTLAKTITEFNIKIKDCLKIIKKESNNDNIDDDNNNNNDNIDDDNNNNYNDDDDDDDNDEEYYDINLIKKFIEVVFQRKNKKKNSKKINVGLKVHPLIKSLILDEMGGKIKYNYGQINVVDVCPVLQCYKCQGFKHKAIDCKQQHHTCAHCAGDHYLSACPNQSLPAKCVNCLRSTTSTTTTTTSTSTLTHRSNSKLCPIFNLILCRTLFKLEV